MSHHWTQQLLFVSCDQKSIEELTCNCGVCGACSFNHDLPGGQVWQGGAAAQGVTNLQAQPPCDAAVHALAARSIVQCMSHLAVCMAVCMAVISVSRLSQDLKSRTQVISWIMFQMVGIIAD
jgi:hypothetical protein